MQTISVTCTTCNARLRVRDEAAYGEIVACPKCGSMVKVPIPEGWKPPSQSTAEKSGTPESRTPKKQPLAPIDQSTAEMHFPADMLGESQSASPALPVQDASALGITAKATLVSRSSPGRTDPTKTPGAPPAEQEAPNVAPVYTGKKQPHQRDHDWSQTETGEKLSPQGDSAPKPVEAPVQGAEESIPRRSMKPFMLVAAPLVAIGVFVGVWQAISTNKPDDVSTEITELENQDNNPADDSSSANSQLDDSKNKPGDSNSSLPVQAAVPLRWLPPDSQFVISCSVDQVDSIPGAGEVRETLRQLMRHGTDLAEKMGIKLADVDRITLGGNDVTKVLPWQVGSTTCVIFELKPGAAIQVGSQFCTPMAEKLGGSTLYKIEESFWPNPVLKMEGGPIVTAPLDTLKQIVERKETPLRSRSLHDLLASIPATQRCVVAIDQPAVNWPKVTPIGLAQNLNGGLKGELEPFWALTQSAAIVVPGEPESSLQLVCIGQDEKDSAELATRGSALLTKLKELCDTPTPEMVNEITSANESLTTPEQAQAFLHELGDSLKGLQPVTEGKTARWSLPGKPPTRFAASIVHDASRGALLKFEPVARHAAGKNLEDVMTGITAFVEKEKSLPQGAIGATLVDPASRWSWYAPLLPYMERKSWFDAIQFERSWNDPVNQPISRSTLASLIHPGIGPSRTNDLYPVTHFVGMAGIGPDAAKLDGSDPRAGIFGFNRRVALADVKDGLQTTIAVATVSSSLGAWASGGSATVRGFSAEPYYLGPDGFGNALEQGTIVLMCDGSARFLANDVDPKILEALATIHGGETVDVSGFDLDPAIAANDVPDDQPGIEEDPQPLPQPPVIDGPVADAPLPDPMDRMQLRLSKVEFAQLTLTQFCEYIGQWTTIPITLDEAALDAAEISPDEPFQVLATQASIGEILERVLWQQGLVASRQPTGLQLTTPEAFQQRVFPLRYKVDDLLNDQAKTINDLAALAKLVVAPSTWSDSEERPVRWLQEMNGELIGAQTEDVHDQLSIFFNKLRIARGLPPETGLNRESLEIASRATRGRGLLQFQVRSKEARELSLFKISDELSAQTGANILVHAAALNAAGITAETELSIPAGTHPLGGLLAEILLPANLDFRVLGPKKLLIVPKTSQGNEGELEFYSLVDLLEGGASAENLMRDLVKEINPTDAELASLRSSIFFDAQSKHLGVWQPQFMQIRLERALDSLRAAK